MYLQKTQAFLDHNLTGDILLCPPAFAGGHYLYNLYLDGEKHEKANKKNYSLYNGINTVVIVNCAGCVYHDEKDS